MVIAKCHGQGTITFDGPPVINPDSAIFVKQYYESGLSFTPINPMGTGFVRVGAQPSLQGLPDNGTSYLQALLGSSLMFSSTNGSLFDLFSVDLAEYSTVLSNATTVHFVGYQQDGTIVTTDFITDGIIDGTGPLADFQTFFFPAKDWTGLTRVEIPFPRWSLDNLVLSIPEPTTGSLLLLGGAILWTRGLSRKRRRP